MTCDRLCAAGVRASAIHSLMPHAVVRAELSRFRNGDLDVLFNVEVGAHTPVALDMCAARTCMRLSEHAASAVQLPASCAATV
jgi:hypothetical protein